MTSVLHKSASVEWYTPPDLVAEIEDFLGGIDLDPCSPVRGEGAPVPAAIHYTQEDDGLSKPWSWAGYRVFCNPPYGRGIEAWIDKALDARRLGCSVVLLIPARTDTRWWAKLKRFPRVFLEGRLKFVSPKGPKHPATFPSALVYLGPSSVTGAFAQHFAHRGSCYVLKEAS